NPIKQAPIYHESRANYILEPTLGMNFWVIPTGALILAIPFIFWRGATDKRLRPLFLFWWLVAMIGLGGTTPIPTLAFGTRIGTITPNSATLRSDLECSSRASACWPMQVQWTAITTPGGCCRS